MRTRTYLCVSMFVIMAAASVFSAAPAYARPDEVTIVVKNASTNQLVGDRVLIFVGTADDPQQISCWTIDGKVVLTGSSLGSAGDTFLVGEPEGESYTQVGSFTLHHNLGARITVYVNPLN